MFCQNSVIFIIDVTWYFLNIIMSSPQFFGKKIIKLSTIIRKKFDEICYQHLKTASKIWKNYLINIQSWNKNCDIRSEFYKNFDRQSASNLSAILYMRYNTEVLYHYKTYTVKPVLRGHLWDKEKVAL